MALAEKTGLRDKLDQNASRAIGKRRSEKALRPQQVKRPSDIQGQSDRIRVRGASAVNDN
jgi:hypothetical protein